jgi:GDP-D-mannose 3', 5'-epimerase
MNLKGKKVLVTGGAGFIGSNLIEKLVENGAIVTVIDNLWRGRLENLNKNETTLIDLKENFIKADLADYKKCLIAAENQDIIYHLADVVAGINYVFGNQLSLFQTNILINTNMLKAAIEMKVKKYVYVGTACSYPKDKQSSLNPPPFKEEDVYPAYPESSYGWSKLIGEYECELAQNEGLIDIGIIRLHNVYGPKIDYSPEKSQVIPSLIRKAISYPLEDFIVWGSGNQRRAFVFVDDVIDALISVISKGMNERPIQIGPDYSTSIKEIAETIVKISNKDIKIKFDLTRPEGDIDRMADWTKAKALLNWQPRTTIETGLQIVYKWIEQQIEINKTT